MSRHRARRGRFVAARDGVWTTPAGLPAWTVEAAAPQTASEPDDDADVEIMVFAATDRRMQRIARRIAQMLNEPPVQRGGG